MALPELDVQDPSLGPIEIDFSNHEPTRTCTVLDASDDYDAGETVTFGTSGATGYVVSWVDPLLTFYLVTVEERVVGGILQPILPVNGETVTGLTSAAAGTVSAIAATMNTCENDDRTVLQASNQSGNDVIIIVDALGYCSDGFHHPASFTIAGGGIGVTQNFHRARFGSVLGIHYVGTTAPGDLLIAAVRAVSR